MSRRSLTRLRCHHRYSERIESFTGTHAGRPQRRQAQRCEKCGHRRLLGVGGAAAPATAPATPPAGAAAPPVGEATPAGETPPETGNA